MASELDSITDPIDVFQKWLHLAETSEPNDANAAALATASSSGIPSVRMVLIKGCDERGLRFFTNANSQKGRDLRNNPVAAACFHWKTIRRQVRFAGGVEALGNGETDAYFHSRSRASQIAAAVSKQSHPLSSRSELEESVRDSTVRLEGKTVPLPADWVGFLLVPSSIEFWMDGPDRLHDRLLFSRESSSWKKQRLYP